MRLQYLVLYCGNAYIGGLHFCKKCWPPTKEWMDDLLLWDYPKGYLLEETPPLDAWLTVGYRCHICEKLLTDEDKHSNLTKPRPLELL